MKKTLILLLLMCSTSVFANEWLYVSGNELLNRLKDGGDRDSLFYISGVVDSISILEPYDREICIEKGTSLQQLGQLTYNHMLKHPEKWMLSGSYFVITMLRETYPCKKQ